MKGRKPVPNAILKLRGRYRKDEHGDRLPDPKVETPTAPPWMTAGAKRLWKTVCKSLKGMGLLARCDRETVAAYCQSASDYGELTKRINSAGVENASRNLLAERDKAFTRMHKIGADLGFSPVARSRIHVSQQEKAKDEFDEFVDGRERKSG